MDGIEYYPKQRRKSGGLKLWTLAVILVAIAVVYYWFDDKQQTPTKPNTNLIVVKEPKIIDKIKTQVISIPLNSKAIIQPETQMNEELENLDETKPTAQ